MSENNIQIEKISQFTESNCFAVCTDCLYGYRSTFGKFDKENVNDSNELRVTD